MLTKYGCLVLVTVGLCLALHVKTPNLAYWLWFQV
jgi:hypothetical protein